MIELSGKRFLIGRFVVVVINVSMCESGKRSSVLEYAYGFRDGCTGIVDLFIFVNKQFATDYLVNY